MSEVHQHPPQPHRAKAPSSKETPTRSPKARRLVVVHGDKGGVGKSTVSRLLADFFVERNIPARGYDGDPSTNDFSRFHKGTVERVDLAKVESIAPILDRLMDGSPTPETDQATNASGTRGAMHDAGGGLAFLDLSARSGADAANWLVDSGALDAVENDELVVTVVFVLGPTSTSVQLLAATYEKLGNDVCWIVAKNMHAAESYEIYDRSKIRADLANAGAVEIAVPSLPTPIYQRIDALEIPFRTARDDRSKLGFTQANYVGSFLAMAFDELDRCADLFKD